MKSFVFVTSFPSPHVMPLMEELQQFYSVIGCISMMEMTAERKSLGYNSLSEVAVFSYSEDSERCKKIILDADVLIMACGNFEVLADRISANKEIFIMHERLLKKGLIKLLDPRLQKYRKICKQAHNKRIYLLPIGVNCAKDFALLGFPKEKIYKFAYFPKVEPFERTAQKKKTTGILWVGRMVGFKRPMMALKLGRHLPPDCTLTMVGNGKLMGKVKRYVKKYHLPVRLVGQICNAEVRQLMQSNDIFLSTSNRGEGWGAVVSEAMNYGCAIVCSDSIGCYGTLTDDENACIFKTHSLRSLICAVQRAISNPEHYQKESVKRIFNEINPREAARRFHVLQESLSLGVIGEEFEKGICSKLM